MPIIVEDALFTFSNAVDNCENLEELGQAFQELVAPYGARASAAWALKSKDRKLQGGFGAAPLKWASHYSRNNFLHKDPVFKAMLHAQPGGYWNTQVEQVQVTRTGERVMSEARDFGFSDGYSQLYRTLGGELYCVCIYGDKLDRDPKARHVFELAGAKFVTSGATLVKKTDAHVIFNGGLTPRQREALQYKAWGYTDREAAIEMGIEVKTLELHLKGARDGLDARTTFQAINLARGANLIG